MTLLVSNVSEFSDDVNRLVPSATKFLKSLAHEGRLAILCHLGQGEKSVGELEKLLGQRQAAVSQMLARLREDDLVKTRRVGKAVIYSLKDESTQKVMAMLSDFFHNQSSSGD